MRITVSENIEQRYEDLAKAIIIQAADDYKRYRFVLDTINFRKYKEVKKVEVFFGTAWFNELSNLNGDFAFKALEKTYLNEYYPERMEEMLDVTRQGRYRFGQ